VITTSAISQNCKKKKLIKKKTNQKIETRGWMDDG
jgi:hypothetical protein